MATIQIRPESKSENVMTIEDQNAAAAIDNHDVEPWWVATCTCGVLGTDRGNFEDTTQWALIHVEGAHE